MANVSNGLTEKQKEFCREYIRNKGNGTKAYLFAYDSKSEVSAAQESSKLLKRDDITEYIKTLNKPIENKITNEREKKRHILWSFIDDTTKSDADRLRAMDLLNKMDQEYISLTRDITDSKPNIENLDNTTLLKLVQ